MNIQIRFCIPVSASEAIWIRLKKFRMAKLLLVEFLAVLEALFVVVVDVVVAVVVAVVVVVLGLQRLIFLSSADLLFFSLGTVC